MEEPKYTTNEDQHKVREELNQLKEEIIWSIGNIWDGTTTLKNIFNPYRTGYGAGIYKNPR